MIAILQIVALIQGIFLILVLISKRKSYKKPTHILLLCSIFSILLFLIGDDQNNLISKDVDWFFFDTSLFITFLLLFVKYYVSKRDNFSRWDLLYFIPNLLYLGFEISEIFLMPAENRVVELLELGIELTFLVYLVFTLRILLFSGKQRWLLMFIFPLVLLTSTSILNDILNWFSLQEVAMFNDANFNSFVMITVAALFYVVSMKLVIAPGDVLLPHETSRYQSSGLNRNLIEEYKQKILESMDTQKIFCNPRLSLTSLSQELEIPKQYISEILNVHLRTSFQDFVNGYRVNAFIACLGEEQYEHFTLMGIASEVGFNSKSSFYSIFKKHQGLTPSEYKKTMFERAQ